MKNRESLDYLNYNLLLLCYCFMYAAILPACMSMYNVHAVPTGARRGYVMP